MQALKSEDVLCPDVASLVLEAMPRTSVFTKFFSLKYLFLPTSPVFYKAIISRIDIRHYK